MSYENLLLIQEVKKRRPLWDTTLPISTRRDMIPLLWFEVAGATHMDEIAAKRRFKSLRDTYRNEIRRLQKQEISASVWTYFPYMDFLRNIFDPPNFVGLAGDRSRNGENGSHIQPYFEAREHITDFDSNDSFSYDVISGDIFNQMSATPDSFTIESVPQNQTQYCLQQMEQLSIPTPPPAKKHKSPKMHEFVGETTQQKQSAEIYAKLASDMEAEKNDSDYNFLISTLPHMKSLSDMGNLKFRMEVSKLLINIKADDLALARKQKETMSIDSLRLPALPKPVQNDIKNKLLNGSTAQFMECKIKEEHDVINLD